MIVWSSTWTKVGRVRGSLSDSSSNSNRLIAFSPRLQVAWQLLQNMQMWHRSLTLQYLNAWVFCQGLRMNGLFCDIWSHVCVYICNIHFHILAAVKLESIRRLNWWIFNLDASIIKTMKFYFEVTDYFFCRLAFTGFFWLTTSVLDGAFWLQPYWK